jgi:hypothetical protein
MPLSARDPLSDYFALAGLAGAWAKTAYARIGPMPMRGQLYASKHTGRLLLRVPSALVGGVFASMQEPGWQLYADKDRPHVVVMSKQELDKIGGPDVVTERGFHYGYRIEHPQIVRLDDMERVSRACVLPVHGPELRQLRRSYGLSDQPQSDRAPFHVVVGVRQRNVFAAGDGVTKTTDPGRAAEDDDGEVVSAFRGAFPATR